MKKFICIVFYFLTTVYALSACEEDDKKTAPIKDPEPDENEIDEQFQYVYEENTHGYQVYRIPAIVQTQNGTLLAFAEARKLRSNGDSGDIDLVVKSSTDDGKSWSEMTIVWDDGLNTCGNPVPIVDNETGRVHLLMTWNHGDDGWGELTTGTGNDTRRAYYTWSDDNGATWETPKEITNDIKDPAWGWYGTGPVHGIQIQNGDYANRLISPNYYTVLENGKSVSYSHVAYSDDNGLTWHSGAGTTTGGVGECTVAELADGSLMMNTRSGSVKARKYSISRDGGESWEAVKTDYSLIDPNCQASMVSSEVDGVHTLYFANAANTERVNMTVKSSENNGGDWDKQYLVHPGASAYSDLVVLSEEQIAILYEGGIGRPYEGIAYQVINVAQLK